MLKCTDLSIITPVYNRKDLLKRLHNAISEIDFQNIIVQWIIVDDGSTDNGINEIPVSLENNNLIIKKIIKENNEGKHTAINKAIPEISGMYTMIIDSDDIINQRLFNNIRSSICWNENESILGYMGYNENQNSEIMGFLPDSIIDINYIFKIKGDYARIIKSKIFKKHKFKEIQNEKFMTELTFWMKIHKEGNFLRINKPIIQVHYQINGLSANYFNLCKRNHRGVEYLIQLISEEKQLKLTNSINTLIYHISTQDKPFFLIKELKISFIRKVFIILTYSAYSSFRQLS